MEESGAREERRKDLPMNERDLFMAALQIEDAAGAMGKQIEREDWYAVRNLLKF